MTWKVEPTGRADEWQWQVRRDGVVIGFYRDEKAARAALATLQAESRRTAA